MYNAERKLQKSSKEDAVAVLRWRQFGQAITFSCIDYKHKGIILKFRHTHKKYLYCYSRAINDDDIHDKQQKLMLLGRELLHDDRWQLGNHSWCWQQTFLSRKSRIVRRKDESPFAKWFRESDTFDKLHIPLLKTKDLLGFCGDYKMVHLLMYFRSTLSICFCWNRPLIISWLAASTEPLVPNSVSKKACMCFGWRWRLLEKG